MLTIAPYLDEEEKEWLRQATRENLTKGEKTKYRLAKSNERMHENDVRREYNSQTDHREM